MCFLNGDLRLSWNETQLALEPQRLIKFDMKPEKTTARFITRTEVLNDVLDGLVFVIPYSGIAKDIT